MSQQGQTFIQTVEADISAAVGWAEAEAVSFASAAWTDMKALFQGATAQQVTIVKSLVAEAEADETAGDSAEVTVADVLTLASQKELAWVEQLPDNVLASLVNLFKTKFGD